MLAHLMQYIKLIHVSMSDISYNLFILSDTFVHIFAVKILAVVSKICYKNIYYKNLPVSLIGLHVSLTQCFSTTSPWTGTNP